MVLLKLEIFHTHLKPVLVDPYEVIISFIQNLFAFFGVSNHKGDINIENDAQGPSDIISSWGGSDLNAVPWSSHDFDF